MICYYSLLACDSSPVCFSDFVNRLYTSKPKFAGNIANSCFTQYHLLGRSTCELVSIIKRVPPLLAHVHEARREPQRGPGGKPLSRGPIPMRRDRDVEGVETREEGNVGRSVPSPSDYGIWESVVSFPSGVRGGAPVAPVENRFYAYLRSERSHLENHFQYL